MNIVSEKIGPKDDYDSIIFAGFWVRLLANNIDLLVLMPLFYCFSIFIKNDLWLYMLCLCAGISYETFFLSSKWRSTPGKKMLGLCVTDLHINSLVWWKALLRSTLKPISMLTFFLGYLLLIFHPQKMSIHDLIVRSYVILKIN